MHHSGYWRSFCKSSAPWQVEHISLRTQQQLLFTVDFGYCRNDNPMRFRRKVLTLCRSLSHVGWQEERKIIRNTDVDFGEQISRTSHSCIACFQYIFLWFIPSSQHPTGPMYLITNKPSIRGISMFCSPCVCYCSIKYESVNQLIKRSKTFPFS